MRLYGYPQLFKSVGLLHCSPYPPIIPYFLNKGAIKAAKNGMTTKNSTKNQIQNLLSDRINPNLLCWIVIRIINPWISGNIDSSRIPNFTDKWNGGRTNRYIYSEE